MHRYLTILTLAVILTACAVASPSAPTATPEPIVLEGSGRWEGEEMHLPWPRAVAHITHSGSGNFLVGVFQSAEYEILVNDAGPFDGTRSIVATGAVMFDVLADGPWTITLLPAG
ncbi:MAG: hypothetical protein GX537_09050 [Actinobacteria bacterium]|nr:hypothetical protein [Actinomycetota bacterium]